MNLFTKNNISSAQLPSIGTKSARPVSVVNSDYYNQRGLNNYSASNQFIKHLTETARSLGILNIGSKILHDNNQGATTWLLSGRDALKVFDAESEQETKSKGFFAKLFTFVGAKSSSDSKSLLKDFYTRSQEVTNIDNLGESWEHFKAALGTNHYSLMSVYDSESKDYRDPVAFAVFERFALNDMQTRNLFSRLTNNETSLDDLPKNLIYLDKYLTKNFDRGLDMKSFEKNVIGAFMNSQESLGSVLVVPWQTDPVQGLNQELVKGINHVGFSKRGSKVEITPRHLIAGQSHPALKAISLFSKFASNFNANQLKALSLAGTVNEVTAGPISRINNSMMQPVKAFVKENFDNIDKNFNSINNSKVSGFNLFGVFDALIKLGKRALPFS